MAQIREIVNEGLARRAEVGIKVRQPLAKAVINGELELNKEAIQIIAEELNVKKVDQVSSTRHSVVLDTEITQTLKNEGLTRDLIRNIQSARKGADLQIENRIKLCLVTESKELSEAIKEFKKLIAQETLAEEIFTESQGLKFSTEIKIEKQILKIELEKI